MMHCLFVCCAILWPIFAGFSCCCCCLHLKFYYAVSDLEHWTVLAHQYPLADSTDSRSALLQAMKEGNAPQPIGKQPIKNLTQKWHSPRQRWWLPNLWRWLQNYFMRKDILINRGISGISCSWSEIRQWPWYQTFSLTFHRATSILLQQYMIFFSLTLWCFSPSAWCLFQVQAHCMNLAIDKTGCQLMLLLGTAEVCVSQLYLYISESLTYTYTHTSFITLGKTWNEGRVFCKLTAAVQQMCVRDRLKIVKHKAWASMIYSA